MDLQCLLQWSLTLVFLCELHFMQFIFTGEMLQETIINHNIYYYRFLQSHLNILLATSNTEKEK